MPDTQSLVAQLFAEGHSLRINGDYEQAISFLRRATDEEPNDPASHLELGLAYCFNGMFDESLREMELAAGLDAANAEIRLHLAKTYTMLGMYEQGITAFRQVLELAHSDDKNHAEALKQLSYFKQMF